MKFLNTYYPLFRYKGNEYQINLSTAIFWLGGIVSFVGIFYLKDYRFIFIGLLIIAYNIIVTRSKK